MGSSVILALSSCMVFSGRIDNPNHPLGAGMEVDVLNLNGLLVTSPMTVEGLDQIELKPQKEELLASNQKWPRVKWWGRERVSEVPARLPHTWGRERVSEVPARLPHTFLLPSKI